MRVARSNAELADALTELGPTVFVPTMGALHEGHASLIHQAAALAANRRLAGASVSIFVNPTQFNDPNDFKRYPKPIEADLAICESAGAKLVYVPSVTDIYPPGPPSVVIPTPPLPDVATQPKLEDAQRPGHFAGVCQVVSRLFDLMRPAAALFGEKDWQQLAVISAMERAMEKVRTHPSHNRSHGRVEIIPCPTRRDPDGLAMSSRNVFLSPTDRTRALAISRALKLAASQATPAAAERAMIAELASESITPEYAVVRDAATLQTFAGSSPGRALIAARVGSVRLIDNAAWPGAT
jgi:pantoate--beta-alanine ligase